MNETKEIRNCFLCDSDVGHTLPMDDITYHCPACGRVSLTIEVIYNMRSGESEYKHILSGYCRDRFERGLDPFQIKTTDITDIVNAPDVPKTVPKKLDRLLLCFANRSEHPGDFFPVDPITAFPLSYSKNTREFNFLFSQLVDTKLINHVRSANSVQVTARGWERVDELSKVIRHSSQAFIAMWFADETQKPFQDGIRKAVTDCGFDPLRVDLIQHNERIDDRIIAEIRKSAFLVADFTNHRGGVYFEAGFALGLGIPVIWLCRKDHINASHFDTRQYNHIVWESEDDLYQKLKDRIEATIPK